MSVCSELQRCTALYGRLYRKPPWPIWRTFGLSAVGGIAGLGISSVVALRILFKAPNKLENQERFKVAVKALREDATRRPGMRGPPQRRSPEPLKESGDDPVPGASWPDSQMTTSSPDNTGHQESERSKWDEIRKAQGVTNTSSWDRLREERQKADMKASSSNGPVPASPPGPGQQTVMSDAEKEMTEQERFDALLETERKLGEEQKGASGGFSRWN
ncbi:hypothetical protein BS47DRAFT_1484424 [Hydnum rufescens UP504]|uniref:Uncharacterized protein n=1 Tax=Hydnum rufescens UP504 TaxID=1448309 RepID=A0A9P6B3G2_9AGAM|nr:hypothetical protein BS47DRAFT_1484424 [Hydnum rufescens UP504]